MRSPKIQVIILKSKMQVYYRIHKEKMKVQQALKNWNNNSTLNFRWCDKFSLPYSIGFKQS
jgi:hypothetical protein